MRKITFRAWQKTNRFMTEDISSLGYGGSMFYYGNPEDGVRIDDEWVLMQFTGLRDRNGKEICEGDILRDKQGAGVVVWNASTAGFCVSPTVPCEYATYAFNEGYTDRGTNLTYTEVIGNIHENPELLK